MDLSLTHSALPVLAAATPAEMIDKLARTPLSQIAILGVVLTLLRVGLYKYLMTTARHQRYGAYPVVKFVDGIADAVVYAAVVVFMLVRPFVLQTFYIPSGSMVDTLRVGDFILLNKFVYRTTEPKHGEVVVFKPPLRALFPGQDPGTFFVKRLIGVPGDLIEWKDKKLYRNGKLVQEPHQDYTVPGSPNGPVAQPETWATIDQSNFKLVQEGDKYVPVQYYDHTINEWDMIRGESLYDHRAKMGSDPLTFCAEEYVPSSEEQAQRWYEAPPAKIPDGYYLFMGDNRNGSFDGRGWGLVPKDRVVGRAEVVWMPMARWKKID